MSDAFANLYQWVVVFAFFLLVIGYMFAEASWISRKGWANFGKAFAFSALSNIVGLGVGFFISFIVVMIFIMLTFDSPLKNSPYENPFFIGLTIFGALEMPIVLLLCKRISLAILKIQTGSRAWIFSLLSSILILIVSLGITTLIGCAIFKLA